MKADQLDCGVRFLLEVIANPAAALTLSCSDWDRTVRAAHAARLAGTVAALLQRGDAFVRLPEIVQSHLLSEMVVSNHRKQMAVWELHHLERALRDAAAPVVLLKGAAYIAQNLEVAEGRLISDVDVLVPKERLHQVERALLAYGWSFPQLDRYDERYYRNWGHELPPLRLPGHTLELDVHHTILPPLGRITVDAARFIADSDPVQGSPFRVLCPTDQVLHACVHLFQDSDCSERLRDLVDVDALIQTYSRREGFWSELVVRAALHGLGRPLWYALHYCTVLLGRAIPAQALQRLAASKPSAVVAAAMDSLVLRALPPGSPDRPPAATERLARTLLSFRAAWLRMPPWLFTWHAFVKAYRTLGLTTRG